MIKRGMFSPLAARGSTPSYGGFGPRQPGLIGVGRPPKKAPIKPYGPRQPNLVGVGQKKPVIPGYGERQPDLVGVGQQQQGTSPVQQQQPKSQVTAGQAASAGAQADYLTQYLAGITDPQERAYVAAQIGPQIAALNAQRDLLNQRAAQEQAAEKGFTEALINAIGGALANIGGSYSGMAGMQGKMGKHAGKSQSDAGDAVTSEETAALGGIGAPDSQIAQLAGQNANTYGKGGAVLEATGGRIPAEATRELGSGVEKWAMAQPTIAAAIGQQNMLALLGQERNDQANLDGQLQEILGGIPKARQDYATQQASQQTHDRTDAMAKYNGGFITMRQAAQQMGLPNWQAYPNTVKGQDANGLATQRFSFQVAHQQAADANAALKASGYTPTWTVAPDGRGGFIAVDTSRGKGSKLPQKPGQQYQHVTVNGHAYTYDKVRGVYLDPTTGKVVQPAGKAPKAPPNPVYKVLRAPDGKNHLYAIDPRDPTKKTDMGLSGTQPKAPPGAKLPPPATISTMVQKWHDGTASGGTVSRTVKNADGSTKTVSTPAPRTGALTYQQAYKRLRAMKLSDVQARQYLNTEWARGENGRPWLAAPERQALKAAGFKGTAHFYSKAQSQDILKALPPGTDPASVGTAYITAREARALQAKHLLPPGFVVQSTGGLPSWIGRQGGAIYVFTTGVG